MVTKYKIRAHHREKDVDEPNDPVLAMLGVGQQLGELESGDNFVERLRSEDLPVPPTIHLSPDPAENLTKRRARKEFLELFLGWLRGTGCLRPGRSPALCRYSKSGTDSARRRDPVGLRVRGEN